jgi:hypothetical protein
MKWAVFLALLALPTTLLAQTPRETGFMVHQWCIVEQQDMAAWNGFQEQTVPILTALQEEGMLQAWYHVQHAWGDEWNVGYVTVADNHRAWLDFWDEYLRRIDAAIPDFWSQAGPLCKRHKDNMYAVHDSRGGP